MAIRARPRLPALAQWWLIKPSSNALLHPVAGRRLQHDSSKHTHQLDRQHPHATGDDNGDTRHSNPAPETTADDTHAQSHSTLSSFDQLFQGLPPAGPSSYTATRTAAATNRTTSKPLATSQHQQPRGMQRQRQHLSQSESMSFLDLLSNILPARQAGATADAPLVGILDSLSQQHQQQQHHRATTNSHSSAPGAASSTHDKAQQAVFRRIKRQLGTKVELGQLELERLDAMREQMMMFDSDVELLRWSMHNVFGFQLDADLASIFPDMSVVAHPPPSSEATFTQASDIDDVKGPASPIYADLLLSLFTLLRDTHRAPHAALHVFQLASATPFSYVKGCTTALYNEVLRTRWNLGDVESVAAGIDDMRSVGVRIDERTRDIVNEIGQAMREDEDLACARFDHRQQQSTSANPAAIKQQADDEEMATAAVSSSEDLQAKKDAVISNLRLFSPRQIAAWARMEKIVQENLEEIWFRKRQADEQKWRDRDRQNEADRQRAEADRPSLIL
ncbi:hypothetical protein OIV83_003199 [Microbotryomycetes sp. JL201]|nr:hypothetical protein OIV83_003199 [Microbotryomycetes sp. JL201]